MPEPCLSNRAGGDIIENIDAEHESDSEPSGFALSVDLSACVGTPALCRVWVRRRARKVQWLANRVRRVAKLRGALLLLAGEHLLPPSEPLRVLRPDDTLRVARVEYEWQHAFSFEDSEENAPIPTLPSPHANAVEHNSPVKSTKESRKPTLVTKTSVPSYKRKFTVGDTLFLLSQTAEEHMQRHTEPVTEHPSESSEQNKKCSEVGYIAKKSISMDEPSYNAVDHDALNRVKRRALALLEEVTEDKDADVVDAPKKKRRRVRRRRPAKLNYSDEPIQKNDDSVENQSQSPRKNHLDLTKQDDSDSASKEKLLGLISPNKQDCSKEDQDTELNNSYLKAAAPVQSLDACPTNAPAQHSPTWVMDYTELPPESQVPVLVRNCAQPRAPRVVRALGSEIPGRQIYLE